MKNGRSKAGELRKKVREPKTRGGEMGKVTLGGREVRFFSFLLLALSFLPKVPVPYGIGITFNFSIFKTGTVRYRYNVQLFNFQDRYRTVPV